METDSFVAMFSTAIKPSADNYTLFREDHEHNVKFDTSLHGNFFLLRRNDKETEEKLVQT